MVSFLYFSNSSLLKDKDITTFIKLDNYCLILK